ncbi:MAG: 4Fe-4S binding protein, partial [Clostridia bacterium]|nr:4Fe-4S binding protein [Clostridia bacterium]
MEVDVTKNISGAECINCGKCASACPTNAIYRPITSLC